MPGAEQAAPRDLHLQTPLQLAYREQKPEDLEAETASRWQFGDVDIGSTAEDCAYPLDLEKLKESGALDSQFVTLEELEDAVALQFRIPRRMVEFHSLRDWKKKFDEKYEVLG